MKFAGKFVCLVAGFLLFSAFASVRIPGKLRKAFEALEIYNYFEAKDLFYKSLKNDSVPASYGLSIIYSRNDNPFFQLDSAYKFIRIAGRNFPALDEKDRAELVPYEVDSAHITARLHFIDSLFYEMAVDENSVEHWNAFIENHSTEPFHSRAIQNRNARAYDLAIKENSSKAFAGFLDKYPESDQAPDARRKFASRLFQEETQTGTPEDYQRFIRRHPESPYVSDAQDRIYEITTASGEVDAYLNFIRDYPDNPNTERAWHTIYKLEIGKLNAKSIAAFSLKYPEYPFMNELRREFEYATTIYYPVMVDSLWGFIDDKGSLRIEPRFDWVEPFSENMALVGKDNKVAFVNKAGTLITDFIYDDGYTFKNGYAVIEKNGLTGAVNRLGEEVIPVKYEDVGEFHDGLFYAQNTDLKYGYLNELGEIAIPFVLDNATNFSDGYAVVEKDGAQGVINRKGELIVDFIYDWIEPFHEDRRPSRVRIDHRFGLIDHHGLLIADTIYHQIGDYSNGLALAGNGQHYGYLNLKADTIIPFIYTYTAEALRRSVFVNYHARVFQKGKVGIIDTTGTKIFPAIFEDTGDYLGPLIPVKKYGKWGYADKHINLAIKYLYDSAGNFSDSLAVVSQKGRFGVIDTLGKVRMDLKYRSLERLDSLFLVSDTAVGLVNLSGKQWVPLIYKEGKYLGHGVIRFITDGGGGPAYYDIARMKFIWRQNDE